MPRHRITTKCKEAVQRKKAGKKVKLLPIDEFWETCLRPYQKEAAAKVFALWGQNMLSLLISIPTGGGKTRLFSYILRKLLEGNNKRALILAHTDTLLNQAEDQLQGEVWPGVEIGMVIGKRREFDKRVIIASVQTLKNHLSKLPTIDLVITDEAHHSVAQTYTLIYDYISSVNPTFLHLGVTATPVRTKAKENLSEVYEEVAYSVSIFRLISEGYLCPIKGYAVETSLDLSTVKVRHGDFVDEDLTRAVQRSNYNATVVGTYMAKAEGRKAVCFAVNRAHAKDLTDLFVAHGVKARYIDGDMDKAYKAKIIKDFRRSRFSVLVNVALFTEGFDVKDIQCVLIARPTRSIGFYTQLVGRGTRIAEGKIDCLVLDFRDQSASVSGLVTLKDLLAFYDLKSVSRMLKDYATAERPLSITPETIGELRMLDEIGESAVRTGALDEMDLLDIKNFEWASIDGNYYVSLRKDISLAVLSVAGTDKYDVFMCSTKMGERWHAKLNREGVTYNVGISLCNHHIYEWGDKVFVGKSMAWRNKPPTEAQRRSILSFFYPQYRKVVRSSSVIPAALDSNGKCAGFITAALSLVAINDSPRREESEVFGLLKRSVCSQVSAGALPDPSSISEEDCQALTINIEGHCSPEDLIGIKRLALMLRYLRGTGFPFQFVSQGKVRVNNGTLRIARGTYPRFPLTEDQQSFLVEKLRPLCGVIFQGRKLELEG